MPNHCSNTFTFKGTSDDIAKLKSLVIIRRSPSDEDYDGLELAFDFNGVIPMPASLDINCGSISHFSTRLLQLPEDTYLANCSEQLNAHQLKNLQGTLSHLYDWEKLTVRHAIRLLEAYPDLQSQCQLDLELGRTCLQNIRLYGAANWYDWSMKNWGTKWNAYELVVHEDSETVLSGYFKTIGSPPQPVFETIAKQFPHIDIEFHYIGESMGFAGSLISDSKGGVNYMECRPDQYAEFAFIHFGIETECPTDD